MASCNALIGGILMGKTAKNLKTSGSYPEVENNCSITQNIIKGELRECQVRNLKESEIECMVSMVRPNGVNLLLYKTARTDIMVLDETFGKMNWQCEYKEIKGTMYCGISVFDENKNQWVTKWDCGIESAFGDKQKGEASDSFKRAGFKWGIGTELYTAPFIWVSSDKCKIEGNKCKDSFFVEKIVTENKVISAIAIKSKNSGRRVFTWQKAGD